jgi:hypothetical protein
MNLELLKKMDKEEILALADSFGIEHEGEDFDYICTRVLWELNRD